MISEMITAASLHREMCLYEPFILFFRKVEFSGAEKKFDWECKYLGSSPHSVLHIYNCVTLGKSKISLAFALQT